MPASSGYWREVIAPGSEATPAAHRARVAAAGVQWLCFGQERVDLRAALEALRRRYGIRRVRLESSGVLNGVLLRSGLVREISLVVHPVVVGGPEPCGLAGPTRCGSAGLMVQSAEALPGGLVWLRHHVAA